MFLYYATDKTLADNNSNIVWSYQTWLWNLIFIMSELTYCGCGTH